MLRLPPSQPFGLPFRQSVSASPEASAVADVQGSPAFATDAPQELFQRVEVVDDRPRLAHLPGAAPFSDGGGDRLTRSLRSSRPPGCLRQSSSFACGESMFFVDIEADVEFSFVHMVCLTHASRSPFGLSLRDSLSRFARLFVRVSLVDPERVPAQHGVVLADRP